MAVRSAPIPAAINKISAIGPETTLGAGGSVTKRFASCGLTKSQQANVGVVRPPGTKYASKHYVSAEWSEFSVDDGVLSYDELQYFLAGICRKTTPTPAVAGASLAKKWGFDSDTFGRDDIQTYVLESGINGGRGGKAPYGVFTEFGFTIARNAETSEMSGSMMAWDIEQGPMTDVDVEDFVPIIPSQVNLYLATDPADLGDTQITNAFSIEYSLGDRQSPTWFLDRSQRSYAGVTEAVPSSEITLMLADESDPLDDILLGWRRGDRLFLRVEAVGPSIETVTPDGGGAGVDVPFSFTADLACQVSDTPDEGEEDDAASVTLSLESEHDPDMGAFRFELVNDRSAL